MNVCEVIEVKLYAPTNFLSGKDPLALVHLEAGWTPKPFRTW